MNELSSNRFILSNFVQMNAIICTLGWTSSDEFPQRYTELLQDAESVNPSPFTLPSVLSLLQEINPETSAIKNFSSHRKSAVAFRDSHLLQIFKSAFGQFKANMGQPNHNTENALLILNACLGFDFLGYSSDQDGHGMTSATQIPSSWKSFLLEENLVEILSSAFSTVPASFHQPLLEALGYLMGTRRSLFNEGERTTFGDGLCKVATKLISLPFQDSEQTGSIN
jgi:exportin-7